MTILRSRLLSCLIGAAIVAPASAAPRSFELDPQRSRIEFTLEATAHDVHGVLVLHAGEIEFDTDDGRASGEIVADMTSAETGNKRRDKRMHEDVLETRVYPVASFKAEKVLGRIAPAGFSEVSLAGVLTFHGADHPLVLPLRLATEGSHVTAEATFTVPFVDWGLQDPSFLFLRVSKAVNVRVRAEGKLGARP